MCTVGIQKNRLTAVTTIQSQVPAKEANCHRTRIKLFTSCHNKPATWKGVGSEFVVDCFGHQWLPFVIPEHGPIMVHSFDATGP
jgi:hypothetical protein